MQRIHPRVVLSNGLRVANFSSPHPFTFTDGSILPACDADMSRSLALDPIEHETQRGQWVDIEIDFALTDSVFVALQHLNRKHEVDIILVALPVMQALKARGIYFNKVRCIRVADRITKTIHIDRFCK